jgi:hypothetical protein
VSIAGPLTQHTGPTPFNYHQLRFLKRLIEGARDADAQLRAGTIMAAGIALAATWNPELAQQVGKEIGRDAIRAELHIVLA